MKELLRGLTPPLIWKAVAGLRRPSPRADASTWEYGAEQPPEFYDWTFEENPHWRTHYTRSHYYPLWTVVADRVRRGGAESVLDIGCGPGQVASLLFDHGVPRYLGVDFSAARIQQARSVCPAYRFEVEDVFTTDLFETHDYDLVLTMEFLEHVEADLDVLRRIRPGTRVIATVPNFPATGHVRHFGGPEAVADRYRPAFASLTVDGHIADVEGKRYYLMDGVLDAG